MSHPPPLSPDAHPLRDLRDLLANQTDAVHYALCASRALIEAQSLPRDSVKGYLLRGTGTRLLSLALCDSSLPSEVREIDHHDLAIDMPTLGLHFEVSKECLSPLALKCLDASAATRSALPAPSRPAVARVAGPPECY